MSMKVFGTAINKESAGKLRSVTLKSQEDFVLHDSAISSIMTYMDNEDKLVFTTYL